MKNADLEYRSYVSVDSYRDFIKSCKTREINQYMSSASSPERLKIYHDFTDQKKHIEVDTSMKTIVLNLLLSSRDVYYLFKVDDDELSEKT